MNRAKRTKPIMADGEVLQKLRTLCLSLPEATERASWGHPNFLAGKKTFVTFERIRGRPSIAFRLDRIDIERLIRDPQFFATPYGRNQWISIWVDTPFDWDFVQDLVVRGYRLVALKRMTAALDGVAPTR